MPLYTPNAYSLYLVLVTGLGNVFGRNAAMTSSSVASAFPITTLYDGQAQEIFMFSAAAADDYVKGDINLLSNPTFSSSASGWTSGGSNIRYRDITVQPNEYLKVTAVTSATATVTIQNQRNGMYLTSAGAWQVASTTCISVNGTASLTFQVEALIACHGLQAVPIRVQVNDYTKFTSLILVPGVNFVSVHGHGFGNVSPLFQYSDDDSSYTTAATMTVDQPAFYSYLGSTALYHRYWKLLLSGTNFEAAWIGELVAGFASALDPAQVWGWHETDEWPSHVHKNDAGLESVTVMTTRSMRGLKMDIIPTSFTGESADKLVAIRRDIWERSKAGAYPIIAVPRSTRPDVVMGKLRQSFDASHELPWVQKLGLEISPMPGPTIGAVTVVE